SRYGTVRKRADGYQLRFERHLHHPMSSRLVPPTPRARTRSAAASTIRARVRAPFGVSCTRDGMPPWYLAWTGQSTIGYYRTKRSITGSALVGPRKEQQHGQPTRTEDGPRHRGHQ